MCSPGPGCSSSRCQREMLAAAAASSEPGKASAFSKGFASAPYQADASTAPGIFLSCDVEGGVVEIRQSQLLSPSFWGQNLSPPVCPHPEIEAMVSLTVNGKTRKVAADPSTPLLWVLRDNLGMTGTKFGCGMQLCGACTVHLDGKPVRSCGTPLSAAAGKKITTIEAIGNTAAGKKVQAAWRELDVPQCGYCQSGQIMSATALLASKPKPTDADIDAAMDGNICRCGTYPRIRAAIHKAAGSKEA